MYVFSLDVNRNIILSLLTLGHHSQTWAARMYHTKLYLLVFANNFIVIHRLRSPKVYKTFLKNSAEHITRIEPGVSLQLV